MNDLIRIDECVVGGESVKTVDARGLHSFLDNKDHFATWIKDRIEQFGFVDNQDFTTYSENPGKGRPAIEYALTLDMAKELSMVERNDRGKQARKYFIECENRIKQMGTVHFLIPKTLPEALRLAANLAEEVEAQKQLVIAMQPKADFHDSVAEAINCHTVQEVAKVIGTGEIRLFRWLKNFALLMNDGQPYQRHLEAGHFRLVQKTYKDKRGESHNYNQVLVTGKGLIYIQNKYAKKLAA